jgi:hypothetical protein
VRQEKKGRQDAKTPEEKGEWRGRQAAKTPEEAKREVAEVFRKTTEVRFFQEHDLGFAAWRLTPLLGMSPRHS